MSLSKNVVVDAIKKIANILNNRPLTVDYYDELVQPLKLHINYYTVGISTHK